MTNTQTCPKSDSCNAAVCPQQKEGKHLPDEGICFYAKEYLKRGSEERFSKNLLSGLYQDIAENIEWLKGESSDLRKRLDKAATTASRLR